MNSHCKAVLSKFYRKQHSDLLKISPSLTLSHWRPLIIFFFFFSLHNQRSTHW